MANPPVTELTTRAREIFRLVVEGYLDSGQPVGSKTLAGEAGLNLSPASIRSVLSDLETLGLLAAPHTSAGRMPTEQGLRLFVDGMMQVAEPTAQERAAIERRLSEPGPIEQALEATSAVSGDGTEPRAAPQPDDPRAAFADDRARGAGRRGRACREQGAGSAPPESRHPRLNRRAIICPRGSRAARSRKPSRRCAARSPRAIRALDEASRDLVERGLAGGSEDAARRPVLIVRGQGRLLDETALARYRAGAPLCSTNLENKQSIAQLLESAREADATRIFIGSENRLFALSGSSVIASPIATVRAGWSAWSVSSGDTVNYARVVPMGISPPDRWAN